MIYLGSKRSLVVDTQRHRYQVALSDLAGADIESHGNQPHKVVSIVRGWLRAACDVEARGSGLRAQGSEEIAQALEDFQAIDTKALQASGFSPDDIENRPVAELIQRMESWLTTRTTMGKNKSPASLRGLGSITGGKGGILTCTHFSPKNSVVSRHGHREGFDLFG